MLIRPGLFADCAGINEVELSAGLLFAGTHMDWAVGEVTGAEDLRIGADSNMLWVAEIDKVIAGFILGGAEGEDFHLREVSVARHFQGQGIGIALVEAALTAAAKRGFRTATLTTDLTLRWNAPWYERLGFRILTPEEIPPRLAEKLAEERNPHLRCAMARSIAVA